MIVYVETNFLLEIAYQQEGCESCRSILDFARQGKLSLVVPAFSIVEARQTWDRRSSEHNALQNQLQPIIRQIARSEPFRTVTGSPVGVKRFLNRDSKGFANPSVYDELANFDCKLIVSFEKGLDFIRSEIR